MVSVSNSVRPDLTVKIDQFLLSNTRPSVSLMIYNIASKRMSHTKWVTKCFQLCQRAYRREKIWFVWWLWHKMATNIQIQDFLFYMERITPQSRSQSGEISKKNSKFFQKFFHNFFRNFYQKRPSKLCPKEPWNFIITFILKTIKIWISWPSTFASILDHYWPSILTQNRPNNLIYSQNEK